jgi:hypothetical protein
MLPGREHVLALGLSTVKEHTSRNVVDLVLYKKVYHREEREPKPRNPMSIVQESVDRRITYSEATLILR